MYWQHSSALGQTLGEYQQEEEEEQEERQGEGGRSGMLPRWKIWGVKDGEGAMGQM